MPSREYEIRSARCLIALGTFVLIPVLMFAAGVTGDELRSAANTIQWDSVSSCLSSAWLWLHTKAGRTNGSGLIALVLGGLAFFLWQWFAFIMGWRTFFRGRRLWAASSSFSVAVIFCIAWSVSTIRGSLELRWITGFILCAPFAILLSIAASLWLEAPRLKRDYAKPFDY